MKLLKKFLTIYLLAMGTILTYSMGGTVFKYTPISVDDLMIMVPYASVTTYTPPANSLEYTTITTTTTGKKIRVDRLL